MDENVLQAGFLSLGEEFVKVVEGRVHSAVGAEAEEVELLSGLPYIVVGGLYLAVLHEFMLTAGHVDLDQVLIDYASGAEVHVSNLGVTHLAVGESDVFAAGVQVGHGIFGTEAVDEGSALGINGIAAVVAAFSPAIQYHQ